MNMILFSYFIKKRKRIRIFVFYDFFSHNYVRCYLKSFMFNFIFSLYNRYCFGLGNFWDFFFFSLRSRFSFDFLLFNLFNLYTGFSTKLILRGIGYRIKHCFEFFKNNGLFVFLGHSHYYYYILVRGLVVKTKRRSISMFSFNKLVLLNSIRELRSLRSVDIYKGKGLLFFNQVVSLKVGKRK